MNREIIARCGHTIIYPAWRFKPEEWAGVEKRAAETDCPICQNTKSVYNPDEAAKYHYDPRVGSMVTTRASQTFAHIADDPASLPVDTGDYGPHENVHDGDGLG